MRRSGAGGDGAPPDEEIQGPLEDPAAVLAERVDLTRSLLDEAELGTADVPPGLAESIEIELVEAEEDAALEAESVIAPPPRSQNGEGIDAEELEAWLEPAPDPAELLSLHDREPLSEVFLDEGTPLDELAPDEVEDAVERHAGTGDGWERAAPKGRPASRLGTISAAPERAGRARRVDARTFRHLLETTRSRLETLRAEFDGEGLRQRPEREDLSSLSAVDQHPADQGTETFDRERDLSIREQVEGELAEVSRALVRLHEGTYGRCEACGQPIAIARLVAEPATRFCLDDQRDLEREAARTRRDVEL